MVATSPSAQRLGPAVILQGAALAEVLHLVALGARERSRQDAIAPSRGLLEVVQMFHDAVSAGSSEGAAAKAGDAAALEDPVGTSEAARILGLSERQTQRLGPSIGVHRVGRGYVYDRAAVVAYREARREQTDEDRAIARATGRRAASMAD